MKVRVFYKRELLFGYLEKMDKDEKGNLLPSPILKFYADDGGVFYLPSTALNISDFIFKIEWPEDILENNEHTD